MLTEELDRRGEEAMQLLTVKPGVTGYWQVNGRSDLDYEDRVRLELAYVGDWSLSLDLHSREDTSERLEWRRGPLGS